MIEVDLKTRTITLKKRVIGSTLCSLIYSYWMKNSIDLMLPLTSNFEVQDGWKFRGLEFLADCKIYGNN